MSVLKIVNYGNPVLRKKCQSVVDFSELPSFIEDMFDTMYEEEGIGLAANQVGVDMNLFIIDIAHTDEKEFPEFLLMAKLQSLMVKVFFRKVVYLYLKLH